MTLESQSRTVNHWKSITMGWLRLVGSLKLRVSFAKEPYKRDDILQKRPIVITSLLIVATLYSQANSTVIVRGVFKQQADFWEFLPARIRQDARSRQPLEHTILSKVSCFVIIHSIFSKDFLDALSSFFLSLSLPRSLSFSLVLSLDFSLCFSRSLSVCLSVGLSVCLSVFFALSLSRARALSLALWLFCSFSLLLFLFGS